MKIPHIKFNENPFMLTDRETVTKELMVAFISCFPNAPVERQKVNFVRTEYCVTTRLARKLKTVWLGAICRQVSGEYNICPSGQLSQHLLTPVLGNYN